VLFLFAMGRLTKATYVIKNLLPAHKIFIHELEENNKLK
jgi:hypothetical protein